jgi:hypothetical protein
MPDLVSLKRRWLPLFAAGAALFGAGLALILLGLYRASPLVDVVVGVLTTPARGVPPRGTLVGTAAITLTLAGAAALAVAVRRINASEVGSIDSFWWKVAIAALAGRWWLGEPRVVVVGARQVESLLPVLRGLKASSGRITLLLPPGTPAAGVSEVLVALAEDEAGVRRLVERLGLPESAAQARELSAALRLRGTLEQGEPSPRLAEAIARADALLFGPALLDAAYPPQVRAWLRDTAARKIGLPAIIADGHLPAADLHALAAEAGTLDAALVNSNTVPPLEEGQHYLSIPADGQGARVVVARDIMDWGKPVRHDAAKLAVFLREVILRG